MRTQELTQLRTISLHNHQEFFEAKISVDIPSANLLVMFTVITERSM